MKTLMHILNEEQNRQRWYVTDANAATSDEESEKIRSSWLIIFAVALREDMNVRKYTISTNCLKSEV